MSATPAGTLDVGLYIARFRDCWLFNSGLAPWTITANARDLIGALVKRCSSEFRVERDVALHGSAVVEDGAVIKGPAFVGPGCFVASGAYLRDGCWLEEEVRIGPGSEIKSSFLFRRASAAHFNFIGDSLLGEAVNLEAGSIVANFRNEDAAPRIVLRVDGAVITTGATKFGALIGDHSQIGANAVLAPGTVLLPQTAVPRLGLVDQRPADPG